MKIIIPAAGMGKRLRPHTHIMPKAMVEVAGYPIIGHIIRGLAGIRPEEIIIITGYMKESLISWVGEEFPAEPVSFVEQKEMLGLGHAVYAAREKVKEEDEVFIILGDTIVDMDIPAMIGAGRSALGVKRVPDPKRFGVAETDGNVITGLVEKPERPRSDLALMGVYYIRESGRLFDALGYLIEHDIRTRNEYQITDALNRMIKNGVEMDAFPVDNWFDCGTIESLLDTNRFLLKRRGDAVPAAGGGTVYIPPVLVGEGAEISRSVIGPYVSVGAGAVISGSVISDAVISADAKICDSVLTASVIGERAVVKGARKHLNLGADGSVLCKEDQ